MTTFDLKTMSMVVEMSPNAIIIADSNGLIQYVNRKFLELTGFVEEEIIGQTPQIFESIKNNPKIYNDMLSAATGGGQWRGELQERKRNGEVFWVKAVILGLRDENGVLQNLVSISDDITERKRADEKLHQAMQRTRRALSGTINVISQLVEIRDPYTAGHLKNVSSLARKIAQKMNLPSEQVEEIRMAGLIYELGKLRVPAEILSKPAKLTSTEFELVRGHVRSGFDALKDSGLSHTILRAVLEHHERLDGSGYPNGLKGEAICLEAKILAIADVVVAMMNHRPYRAALGINAALVEIQKNKGLLYDPIVADTCFKILTEENPP